MKKPTLIVIAGPTATGKSELAAELGRRISGEVVSADSMQVYRYMDIGSAKVTYEEMLGVPHHMIDVLDPKEEMDVSLYASMAKQCIGEICSRGNVPILCGGTGFYIQAVTKDIDFTETRCDEKYREELRKIAREEGNEALHSLLRQVDAEAASEIHPNNIKRVIRALEFYRETHRKISEHNEMERQKESPYDLVYFVIEDDRASLYERINRRVDFMVEEGLYDEVAYLAAMGLGADNVSMQGIGYKEMLPAVEGKCTVEEAVYEIKLNSRHYAKRQLTWFRREKDVIRLNRADYSGDTFAILDKMLAVIGKPASIHPCG